MWELLAEISPDLALLQEVGDVPNFIDAEYKWVMSKASGNRFYTAILARGSIGQPIPLSSRWDWVNRELELFQGNLVAHSVSVLGHEYRVVSVYSPAWPLDPARLRGVEVEPVKLKLNPKVWVTELLWAALLQRDIADDPAWVVGGDLNASETFDEMWPGGPHGNREILDRMSALGFVECLRRSQGTLVPTFRNLSDGKIVHQMDHLFVSGGLASALVSCATGEHDRVFGTSLSDHLPIVAEFTDSQDVAV